MAITTRQLRRAYVAVCRADAPVALSAEQLYYRVLRLRLCAVGHMIYGRRSTAVERGVSEAKSILLPDMAIVVRRLLLLLYGSEHYATLSVQVRTAHVMLVHDRYLNPLLYYATLSVQVHLRTYPLSQILGELGRATAPPC